MATPFATATRRRRPPALTTYGLHGRLRPGCDLPGRSAPSTAWTCAMPTGGECVFTDPRRQPRPGVLSGPGRRLRRDVHRVGVCHRDLHLHRRRRRGPARGSERSWTARRGRAGTSDCPSFGATCSDGACVGVPEGGTCGDGLECAATLMCSDEFECVAPMVADAGTTGSDAGSTSGADATAPRADASTSPTDAGLARADAANSSGGGAGTTDSSGCSTSGASAASGLVSALLLLGLGLVSRRRRVR
jgi:MYXO-CTERM domain-containing protein